jgi:hypothetical protein
MTMYDLYLYIYISMHRICLQMVQARFCRLFTLLNHVAVWDFQAITAGGVNDEGQPIHSILARIFGWRFIFSQQD